MIAQELAKPAEKYARLALDLDLIHDLMGGTRAMRQAGLKWLPREQAESWEAWRQRLYRSILFNGLARSWQAMVGQVIPSAVTLEDAASPLMALSQNIDGRGASLTGFACRMAELLLRDGAVYVLVDAPDTGGMPYFVLIEAGQMLAINGGDMSGAELVRIREKVERREDRFNFTTAEQVRVYERGKWSVWQQDDNSNTWQEKNHGEMGIEAIPLAKAELTTALGESIRPPLLDLAWLNLAHWQSASDQRHILHIARVPILFARGMNSHDGPLDIGPNRLIIADDPSADIKFVEHSGAAIEAGRQDLIDLEDKMAMLGLDMLREHRGVSGQPTATARAIDYAQSNATLATVRESLRENLTMCFRFAAMWLGLPQEAAGKVVLPDASLLARQRQDDADLLLKARLAGDISKDHFLHEIERRGILASTPAETSSETS